MHKLGLFSISIIVILLASQCNRNDDEEPVEEKPIKTSQEKLCSNTCYFANDSICDDGGPGAPSNYCELGTDCADCGERLIITVED